VRHDDGDHVHLSAAIMTLHIDAVKGHSTWWMWAIRDTAGVVVEESATQFRSAAAAEAHGRARLAVFEERRRRPTSR
jgi:hypothetical protein